MNRAAWARQGLHDALAELRTTVRLVEHADRDGATSRGHYAAHVMLLALGEYVLVQRRYAKLGALAWFVSGLCLGVVVGVVWLAWATLP